MCVVVNVGYNYVYVVNVVNVVYVVSYNSLQQSTTVYNTYNIYNIYNIFYTTLITKHIQHQAIQTATDLPVFYCIAQRLSGSAALTLVQCTTKLLLLKGRCAIRSQDLEIR